MGSSSVVAGKGPGADVLEAKVLEPQDDGLQGQFSRMFQGPAWFPVLAGLYLLACYFALFLSDVMQWGDVQGWLATHAPQQQVWWYLFADGGPTEVLQWSLLITTAVGSGILVGRLRSNGMDRAARFWILLGVTAAILAVEDPADMRDVIARAVTSAAGLDTQHFLRQVTIMVYYAAIACVPVFALVKYWRVVWDGPSRYWILGGFAAYAIAGFASATRKVGSWYDRVGNGIDGMMGGRLSEGFTSPSSGEPNVGFWIVDLVIEESLELMAAALLMAAVFAYSRHIRLNAQVSQDEDRKAPAAPDEP